jgi:isocitrate/isopropylmalate dehydrogenase
VGVEFSRAPEELCALEGAEGLPRDAAISIRAITPRASERILRAAFECARRHERSKVTVVHKANILRESDGVFLAAAHRVAAEYPEIPWDEARIDTMCMRLLKSPLDYDVIVSTNLFSDILSDLCAQMVGGMGFAPSANIGDDYALFEPAHGSAPQYAGQNKVNPTAAILAAGMMLDWLGECDKARQLEGAVAEVIAEGTVGTYDMGGNSSTWEMAQAIADKL